MGRSARWTATPEEALARESTPRALLRAWLDTQAQAHGGYAALAQAAGLSWETGQRLAQGRIPQRTTLTRLLWHAGARPEDIPSLWEDARQARRHAHRPERIR